MWSANVTEILDARQHIRILEDDVVVSYDRVLDLWQNNSAFRQFWTATLIKPQWSGIRWETPSVTVDTVGREFECVLIRCDQLERTPDTLAFADHFRSMPESGVVSFRNLGGDASLVVPCPTDDGTNYVHLASFLRTAGDAQSEALWAATAVAMRERLGEKPVWLSTAGMGVAWLHVRLDSRPKYYGHAPYRDPAS